jgi:cobalt-zinc-cadmium efflux system membrane fusion protein
VQYFSVVIALDKTDRAAMKPGQRVHATLVTEAVAAIVVPRQAVSEKDGRSIVYRRGDHGFAPVTVALGAATPGRVAILSGLAPGDVIALRDPTPAPPRGILP